MVFVASWLLLLYGLWGFMAFDLGNFKPLGLCCRVALKLYRFNALLLSGL